MELPTSASTTDARLSQRGSSIGREVAPVVVGHVVAAAGLLFAVRLLTNALSAYEYGIYVLALTVAVLVSNTVLGPLGVAAQRYYSAAREAGQLHEFWYAVRLLGSLGSGGVLLVCLLAAIAFSTFVGSNWLPIILVTALYAVLSGWEFVFDGILNAQRRRLVVACHQAVRQWLRPLLAVAAIAVSGGGATAGLVGYAVASVLVLASQMKWAPGLVSRDSLRVRSPAYARLLLNFAAPLAGSGLFTWAQLSSDRWALGLTAGPSATAMYNVVFQLGAQPLFMVCTAAAQFLEPIIYGRAGKGDDRARVRDAFQIAIGAVLGGAVLVLLAVLFGVVASHFIFSVFAAPEYQSIAYLLPLGALAGGLYSIGQFFAVGILVIRNPRALLAPRLGTAILGVGLNLVGAWLFGVPGVLAAVAAAALVYCLWMLTISTPYLRART